MLDVEGRRRPDQTMQTRFRGEYAEALVVNSADELESSSPVLQEGLRALLERLNLPQGDIEYSGYALVFFPEPTEELAFYSPETAAALIEAFKAAGIPVRTDFSNLDDYIVHPGDCLDWGLESPGYYPTDGLIHTSYLITPVVREKGVDELSERDTFSQFMGLHARHASAVRMSGVTLLEGLLRTKPWLDSDRIPSKEIAAYLKSITENAA